MKTKFGPTDRRIIEDHIKQNPHCTVAEITAQTGYRIHDVNGTIQRLQNNGIIIRTGRKDDKKTFALKGITRNSTKAVLIPPKAETVYTQDTKYQACVEKNIKIEPKVQTAEVC